MKAVDANLLDLLKVTNQFEVPIYQRAYAWGSRSAINFGRTYLGQVKTQHLGRNSPVPLST
jgi:hypothetical protein